MYTYLYFYSLLTCERTSHKCERKLLKDKRAFLSVNIRYVDKRGEKEKKSNNARLELELDRYSCATVYASYTQAPRYLLGISC